MTECANIEELIQDHNITELSPTDRDKIISIVRDLYTNDSIDRLINNTNDIKEKKKQFQKILHKISCSYRIIPNLVQVLNAYRYLVQTQEIIYNRNLEILLTRKIGKSLSGIVSITVLTAPNFTTIDGSKAFSCKFNCYMCPNEPGQPRSYLHDEPGVLRANKNKFIAVDQFYDRIITLSKMGHPIDKIELLILGGTITSYPKSYITEFIRDLFYAANTTYDKINNIELRSKLSIVDEHNFNQNISLVKIIGLTIETRPDEINKTNIEFFRYTGVTRVQLGIQHIDDDILKKINRMCTHQHNIKAIKLLLNTGFKVDIHIMPDLPGANVEIDHKMFKHIIESEEYQVDQWKIYPCKITPYTIIKEWYENKTYIPYSEQINQDGSNPLTELLINIIPLIPYWIRVNRIERDIPSQYIIGGIDNTSYRNDLDTELKKRNLRSNDIRNREIGYKSINIRDFDIKVRTYNASGGIEYYISWENTNNDLLGHLRLRINNKSTKNIFKELDNCALIRELHIYGQTIHHLDSNIGEGVQHKGLGKKLIDRAKQIAIKHNLYKLSVISGVGVRNYYLKLGFEPASTFVDDNNNKIDAKGNYLIIMISNSMYWKLYIIFYKIYNTIIYLIKILFNIE
jgi:ELP3 family radical SAM enzyme/protein acetyltransferase